MAEEGFDQEMSKMPPKTKKPAEMIPAPVPAKTKTPAEKMAPHLYGRLFTLGRMLCEDVGAQQPTIGALEAACRELRRTSRFIPAISEVLTALAAAEESQIKIISTLSSLPEARRKLVTWIAEGKAEGEARSREWERLKELPDRRYSRTTMPPRDEPF